MSDRNKVVPDEVLNEEFLSQFKTEGDVSKFLKTTSHSSLGKNARGRNGYSSRI